MRRAKVEFGGGRILKMPSVSHGSALLERAVVGFSIRTPHHANEIRASR